MPPATITSLILQYKERLKSRGISDEVYKFKLIKKFGHQWNIEASDFGEMFRTIDFGNLVFQSSKTALVHIANTRPEQTREVFQHLYNESIPLGERIPKYQNSIDTLFDEVRTNPNHKAWPEERSIATFLAFRYPEKYFMYKDSFYGPLCELVGEDKEKPGKKYLHYLKLAKDIRDQYISTDAELIESVNQHLDEDCYKDPSHTILTQDILYTILDKDVTDPNEEQLLKRIRGIGNKQALKLYFEHLNILFTECSIDEDDPRLYLTVRKDTKRIAFTYGQRYIHILQKTGNILQYAFIVSTEDAKRYSKSNIIAKSVFSGPHPMGYITISIPQQANENNAYFTIATLKGDCINALAEEKERGSKFTFQTGNNKKAHNPLIYKMAMDEEYRNTMLDKALPVISTTGSTSPPIKPIPTVELAKNIILYGPPGTGKTYSTIDLSVKIADKDYGNHKQNKQHFDMLRKEGYIEFITFHQNYSYEDFVVGLRPVESSGNLVFKKHEGIFYDLCKRAEANYLNSKQGVSITTFEHVFEPFFKPVAEGNEIEVKLLSGDGTFHIYDINETTIFFRKQNGNTDHSLSIATLKDIFNQTREITSGLKYYYKAIIRDLKGSQTQQATEPYRSYVLIIDEINRANISKVFGELITLLEEDKRIDGDNELRVTLPNGERSFGIPPNLYVIGTMNTADKSIAHIDLALRRRFDFIGKYPDTSNLSPLYATVLNSLNKCILEYKKSPDFLIGHGYFIGRQDSELQTIIKYKVLPLLNEYFIGRTDIIKETLKSASIDYTENTNTNLIEII